MQGRHAGRGFEETLDRQAHHEDVAESHLTTAHRGGQAFLTCKALLSGALFLPISPAGRSQRRNSAIKATFTTFLQRQAGTARA